MARGLHRLSAAALKRNKVGLFPDGGGLYLQVTAAKSGGDLNRSWLFRSKVAGRDRWMGGGPTHTVSLAEAREWARQQRLLRLSGIDPIVHRDAERASKAQADARSITFEAAANGYMAAHRDSWRSHKHAAEWAVTLRKYALPTIGKLPVAAIDTPLVLKVLQPIWASKQETASRLRGRIESILDYAVAAKVRPEGPNCARWSNHLEYLLASPAKRQTNHHAAMAFIAVPAFGAQLRALEGSPPRALEFLICSATRSGETLGARWDEIDLRAKLWTIPADRTKAHREFVVPLSARCIEILEEMAALRTGEFVFPGFGQKGRLSPATFNKLLHRLGHDSITPHGFRSAFRDWAGDRTSFPREVAEAALAHIVGNKTELAYRRGSALEKRRLLMEAWAQFLATPASEGEVVPLRRSVP